jgi:hypothetical protein
MLHLIPYFVQYPFRKPQSCYRFLFLNFFDSADIMLAPHQRKLTNVHTLKCPLFLWCTLPSSFEPAELLANKK